VKVHYTVHRTASGVRIDKTVHGGEGFGISVTLSPERAKAFALDILALSHRIGGGAASVAVTDDLNFTWSGAQAEARAFGSELHAMASLET
jgi:hypothetical protein